MWMWVGGKIGFGPGAYKTVLSTSLFYSLEITLGCTKFKHTSVFRVNTLPFSWSKVLEIPGYRSNF